VRRQAVWLVTLPLVLAGIEGAHAAANAALGAPEGEVFATAASGRDALMPVAASLVNDHIRAGMITRYRVTE